MTNDKQQQYYQLIDRLLQCPNGQEPEVLEAHADLIDRDLVNTMMQVATYTNSPNSDYK